ncbi:MAG: D-alanyl-D-alanine carboxypeptidase [Oscillospiraceae bacterium]|nr:D-alanyl-D-alanine carboxypeptidase [Oscillospiraceae bacterium]
MRKFSIGLVILLLVASVPLSSQAVQTSAKSAALMDATSGRVLYAHNADQRLPMASTTKIMTALVAAENSNLDDIVVVDAATTGVEGSSMYLRPDEEVTVRDLLYGVLLQSGNDAALTLAVHVGGSEEAFVALMNVRAAGLGLTSTSFANPHGLDAEGHYTTARELAVVAAAMLANEELAQIAATKTANVAGRTLNNHNKMLHRYDDADGVKTGFTRVSGRCLVSSATRNGQTLIAVTLNAPDDWNDHTAMLNYGFSTYPLRCFIENNIIHETISVIGGVWPTVDLVAAERAAYPLTDTELAGVTVTAQAPWFVFAGVRAGDVAGWLIVRRGDEVLMRTALVFDTDVPQAEVVRESPWRRFVGWVRGWWL